MFEEEANLHASIMAWDEDEDDWELIKEYISDNYSDGTYYLYIVQSNKDYSKHYLVLCFECFDTKIYLIK